MCRHLVPQYDFLQDEVLRIADLQIAGIDRGSNAPVIVDLGAGSGIFLERAPTRWPNASAYWVDNSEAFCDVAQENLGQFDGRVKYVLSTFEEDWESQVEEADLILSMSAIHHLESAEKKALYRRAFDALKPGGRFFNIDEMQTLYKDSYLENMRFWVKHAQDVRSKRQGARNCCTMKSGCRTFPSGNRET
jgi:tRNA (cmo5U34)-methyltransferase